MITHKILEESNVDALGIKGLGDLEVKKVVYR